MSHYEEAIKLFEQQLTSLESLNDTNETTLLDRSRALGNLGISYEALGHTGDALNCHEQQLSIAMRLKNVREQEKAYRGMGRARETSCNYQEALVCFEKRLLAAHESDCAEYKAAAYGDLGRIHVSLGNYQQAISCLTHQLTLTRGLKDKIGEGEAASGLGVVYLLMNDPLNALKYHQLELTIAESLESNHLQAKACANLATVRESLGKLDEAIQLQEQSLGLAAAAGDLTSRAAAFSGLGRLHHLSGDLQRALSYLKSGLSLAESLGRREDVAKLRHRLGLVHWESNEPILAVEQLEKAAALLEPTNYCAKQATTTATDVLTQTYRLLQKILVSLGRHQEALDWAERSRRFNAGDIGLHYSDVSSLVDRQRGVVLYYSEVDEELHSWCLIPGRGLMRFHSSSLADGPSLDKRVLDAREAILIGCETISSQDTNLDEKLSTRGHPLNASSYSLSSLFSVGSVSSRAGSARWSQQNNETPLWQTPVALQELYDLLFLPFEDLLPASKKELVLVVEDSLYLAPLPALQAHSGEDYLCERFSLLVVKSLSGLKRRLKNPLPDNNNSNNNNNPTLAALVVGNPKLSEKLREKHGWPESVSSAESEANIVAELLETRPLIGAEASCTAVMNSLAETECVHLTVPVLCTKSDYSIGLASNENIVNEVEDNQDYVRLEFDDRLAARLIVISSGHWGTEQSTSAARLGTKLLKAGVQCVLVNMWPVSGTAGSILLRAFYSALLQGQRASRALADAMQQAMHTRHFRHPRHWAGWLLLGDTRLSPKCNYGQALADLLRSGPEQCRDALRVSLHLVEKSLQRINCGQKNAMYTTQKSIENKCGSAIGWRELLMSVGFRFEPAGNGIKPSVFFPQSDPEERLTRCSASLQALLGLGQQSVHALVQLLQAPEAAEDVIAAMRRASCATEGQEITLPMRVWRATGSHELFASLGFDLMEVGQLEITLRTGKQASRRSVQFALQALIALFDTQETPKNLSLGSASSIESLASATQSGTLLLEQRPRHGGGGAFVNYVRHRGEPDGKTMETPSRSLSRLNLIQNNRENPIPALPQTTLERLSVRSENSVKSKIPQKKQQQQQQQKNRYNDIVSDIESLDGGEVAAVTTKFPPRQPNQYDHYGNVRNLTSLTRELTPMMSEVYYERSIGLGLAPSLSKLLEEVGNSQPSPESEEHERMMVGHSQTTSWLQLCRRDEADGRSIAESQCSTSAIQKNASLV